jgi:hypothetical protein
VVKTIANVPSTDAYNIRFTIIICLFVFIPFENTYRVQTADCVLPAEIQLFATAMFVECTITDTVIGTQSLCMAAILKRCA